MKTPGYNYLKMTMSVFFISMASLHLYADNTDDFDSFFVEENTNYTQQYVTADGWSISNCSIKDIGEHFAPTLSGNIASPGTIVSPEFPDGIDTLCFRYMCYYTDKTVDVTIKIYQNDEIVYSYHLTNTSVSQKEVYDVTLNDIGITGAFIIEIVNNCPSGLEKFNVDRTSVWDIRWENFNGNEQEMTQECNVIYRDYEYGDIIEFDNPEDIDILYCLNGEPDYTNIYTGPSWSSPDEAVYHPDVTYNHTTHPLIFRNEPINARYVSYQNGKLPSAVHTLELGSSSQEYVGYDHFDSNVIIYYDIFGRPVIAPDKGIYIKREGSVITKIFKQ